MTHSNAYLPWRALSAWMSLVHSKPGTKLDVKSVRKDSGKGHIFALFPEDSSCVSVCVQLYVISWSLLDVYFFQHRFRLVSHCRGSSPTCFWVRVRSASLLSLVTFSFAIFYPCCPCLLSFFLNFSLHLLHVNIYLFSSAVFSGANKYAQDLCSPAWINARDNNVIVSTTFDSTAGYIIKTGSQDSQRL